uniref:Uncharacterized protein n=1 Tax=Arundo donax TaxID=35708 RepID=A0A0A9F4X5_ARUDO
MRSRRWKWTSWSGRRRSRSGWGRRGLGIRPTARVPTVLLE